MVYLKVVSVAIKLLYETFVTLQSILRLKWTDCDVPRLGSIAWMVMS